MRAEKFHLKWQKMIVTLRFYLENQHTFDQGVEVNYYEGNSDERTYEKYYKQL